MHVEENYSTDNMTDNESNTNQTEMCRISLFGHQLLNEIVHDGDRDELTLPWTQVSDKMRTADEIYGKLSRALEDNALRDRHKLTEEDERLLKALDWARRGLKSAYDSLDAAWGQYTDIIDELQYMRATGITYAGAIERVSHNVSTTEADDD